MVEGTFGARIIAQALKDLGVTVVFGLPGLPVIDIGQESMNLGMRFISFRNEQAAVYAACAYGYLTGKPGVCICVGGPGIFHTMAGIPHAEANSWPLLVLAGSSETHNANKMAFQEVDVIPMISAMKPKLALRPPQADMMPKFIKDAYRASMFGRPGPSFIDLPANLIMGYFDVGHLKPLKALPEAPVSQAPDYKVRAIADAIKSGKAPLVVIGKGAAYSHAEQQIRTLIDRTGLPFVPSPMAKGVVPDSSSSNFSAARSAALKEADVVLVLGGKLNWVLSFGLPPKWNPNAKIIQVDIDASELGKNGGDPELSVVGDVALVVEQIMSQLGSWQCEGRKSAFWRNLQSSKSKNEEKAGKRAAVDNLPMGYERAFNVIKDTLDSLSTPKDGDIVYVSEGANAMDISRSIFTMEHPRIRLDAGTYATMGVGPGYAIAAYAAYNFPNPQAASGTRGRKKIVAIEGDSAFGMSAMELETMSRFQMDILVFVINNSGLYQGDAYESEKYKEKQKNTVAGDAAKPKGLRATSLGFETDYQKIAEMAGGLGFVARTPDELKHATKEGFKSKLPVVVNVIVDPKPDMEMTASPFSKWIHAEISQDFSWLDMAPPEQQKSKL